MKRAALSCLSACLPFATGAALAAEFQYSVGVGAGHTDNVRRTSTAPQSDTIGSASLQLGLLREGRLSADVAADLAYQTYFNDTYGSDLVGSLRGQLVYALVPERLQWVVADNFGQTRPNLFAPTTPENRENINYFSTGPDAHLRLGSELALRLGARFSRVDYQTSPYDSDRWSGSLALEHVLNSGAAISLNAVTQRVNFTQALAGPDFDRNQLYAGYALAGARTTLQLHAGVNQIKRGGETTSGGMATLDLQRHIAGRSIFTIGIGRELTDAGTAFGTGGQVATVSADTQSLAQGSNPYTNTYARAGWDVAGRVTRLGGSVGFYRESYVAAALQDRDRLQVEVHASRDLSPRLSIRVNASHSSDNYDRVSADAREMVAGAGLSWRAGRRLSIDTAYEHSNRHADVATSEYTENRIWLTLRWGDATIRSVGPFGAL